MTKPINGIDLGYNQLAAQQKITAEQTNQAGNLSKIADQTITVSSTTTNAIPIANTNIANPAFNGTDLVSIQNKVITEQKTETIQTINQLKEDQNSLIGINNIFDNSNQLTLSGLVRKFSIAISEFQKNGSNINYQQIIMASDKLHKGCYEIIEQLSSFKNSGLVNQNMIASFSENITEMANLPSEVISSQKPFSVLTAKFSETTAKLNSQINKTAVSIETNELILNQLNSNIRIEPEATTKVMMNEMIKMHQACDTAEGTNRMIDIFTSSVVESLG